MRIRSIESKTILIVGDSGEAALVAAIYRATNVSLPSNENESGANAGALWARSVAAAQGWTNDSRVSRILIDEDLLEDAPRFVDSRSRAIPLRTIRSELEARFGRISPTREGTPEHFVQETPKQSRIAELFRRGAGFFLTVIVFLFALPMLFVVGGRGLWVTVMNSAPPISRSGWRR